MAKAKEKKTKAKKRTVVNGRAFVSSTYNNTIVTLTDTDGNVLCWSSAGANGFKGAKKATPYAAQVAAESAVEKAKVYGLETVDVFVRGVGSGREQAVRGLISGGLAIESITDTTPVPHNGCRVKKARRV